VVGANVSGTVEYYGGQANDGVSVTVASLDVETGSDGQASFRYDQDVLGAAGAGESLVSAPGWHVVELDVAADSRPAAPLLDTETTTVEIPYLVLPASSGEAGAQASAACYDDDASNSDRNGAEDRARLTVTPGGEATAALPEGEAILAGASAAVDQGGECRRGYAAARVIAFDAVVQACYNGEAGVHVTEAACAAGEPGDVSTAVLADQPVGEVLTGEASGEGGCFVRGEGGQDEATIAIGATGVDSDAPAAEALATTLFDCATSGAVHCRPHHECRSGGSYMAVQASAADGAVVVSVDTVPATDAATGASDPGATTARAEGACYYNDEGDQDSAHVSTAEDEETQTPAPDAVTAGVAACLQAASAGTFPDGGSYVRFETTVAGQAVTVTVDSVPVSAALAS
jgi:hypothetical protein